MSRRMRKVQPEQPTEQPEVKDEQPEQPTEQPEVKDEQPERKRRRYRADATGPCSGCGIAPGQEHADTCGSGMPAPAKMRRRREEPKPDEPKAPIVLTTEQRESVGQLGTMAGLGLLRLTQLGRELVKREPMASAQLAIVQPRVGDLSAKLAIKYLPGVSGYSDEIQLVAILLLATFAPAGAVVISQSPDAIKIILSTPPSPSDPAPEIK